MLSNIKALLTRLPRMSHRSWWLSTLKGGAWVYWRMIRPSIRLVGNLRFSAPSGVKPGDCNLLLLSAVPGPIAIRLLKWHLHRGDLDIRDVCCVTDGSFSSLFKAHGIPVLSLSDIWTDTAEDIRIHTEWRNFRERRYQAPAPVRDIQALIEIKYSTLELYIRRAETAIERARQRAKTVIVCFGRYHWAMAKLVELSSSSSARYLLIRWNHLSVVPVRLPVLTLPHPASCSLPAGPDKVSPTDRLRAEAGRLCAVASGEQPVVVICDAAAASPHARVVQRILSALRGRGTPVMALIGSRKLAAVLWRTGLRAESPRLPLTRPRSPALTVQINAFFRFAEGLSQAGTSRAERAALWWARAEEWRFDVEIAWETRALLRLFFQRSKVRSVLLHPHWSETAHLAALAARDLGIPVISAPILTVEANNASIVGWDLVDIIPAYGEQCVDAFCRMGVPSDKLPVIGNLSFDEPLHLERADARRRFFDQCGGQVAEGQRVVLVATSSIDPDEGVWITEIARLCQSRGDGVVVVRLHPAMHHLEASVQAKLSPLGVLVTTRGVIDDAIAGADLVVTDFSTVGAQAVIMGRPLLVVNLTGQDFPANDYAAMGVAVVARCLAEVVHRVNDALDGKAHYDVDKLREFGCKYNGPNDGRAVERLCQLLETYETGPTALDSQRS